MTSSHLFSTRWFQGRLPGVGCQGNLFPFPKIEEKWKERGEKKRFDPEIIISEFPFLEGDDCPFCPRGRSWFSFTKKCLDHTGDRLFPSYVT